MPGLSEGIDDAIFAARSEVGALPFGCTSTSIVRPLSRRLGLRSPLGPPCIGGLGGTCHIAKAFQTQRCM